MLQEMLNTCLVTTESFRPVAYYTHLVSAGILFLLGIYVLLRNRKDNLTKPFFLVNFLFTIWLVFDVILWTQNNYHLINAFWSVLDFVAILAFLSSVMFFYSFCFKEKIKKIFSFIIAGLVIFPFIVTLFGYSINGFEHAVCESYENPALTLYKIIIEVLSILSILIFMVIAVVKKIAPKGSTLTVGLALSFFLGVFASTGYFASLTGIYEIELYGLFALPMFLMVIVFSIVKFDLFNLKIWSQQLIAYSLVVLVGAKIFFADGFVDLLLNSATLIISLVFVFTLTRSIKKENEARQQMEFLNKQLEVSNKRLKELDEQKTEFISLASHQLRGPLTAIKGYASMVLEGDFGQFSSQIKEAVETIYKSTQALVVIVGDYLDISRIEQGRMKYDFTDFDVKELAQTVVKEVTPNVSMSNLSISFTADDGDFMTRADQGKIKQVISNLIDNASKYTKQGGISVNVGRNKRDDILISIKDTGVGISPEVLPRLFEKFSRAPDASKANIMGTGLGLYVARKIIEAHRGKIWVESEGKGKGSTFFIELEPIHSSKRPQFAEIQGNISKEE